MRIQRKIILVKYWLKIINLEENCLLKQMYNILKIDADNENSYRGKNWAYHIKSILQEIGMSNLWLTHTANQNNFISIKNRILDIYKQDWYRKINNSSRLSSYCIFKHEFNQDLYLSVINTNKFRIALTKFRLSAHNLAIETGRHQGTPREERKCQKCTMNVIENEFHFLLICPNYYNLRKQYLKPYFCRWPTIKKFELLMTSRNPKEIINLSKYLYFAFQKRELQNI
jgi:hypothetical protein